MNTSSRPNLYRRALEAGGSGFLRLPCESTLIAETVSPASWLFFATGVPLSALKSGRLFQSRLARAIFKGLAVLAVIGVLGVGALLGALWLEHRTELTLPTPAGSFAVGRAIFDWADDSHPDTLAPVPGTKRELLVWIWYPSAPGPSVAVNDYVPAELRGEATVSSSPILRLLTRDLSKVHSHSIPNAEVSPSERTYPVVMIRTGASLGVLTYSTLAENLASHGYIVVGFDAPYRTALVAFPDGRVIARTPENNPEFYDGQPQAGRLNELLHAWTTDMGYVFDRLARLNASDPSGMFTGRLDLARAGVFGHSFGGAQAAQFCSQDSRCKAGVDVDGRPLGSVVQAGLRQPFMFLLSDQNTSGLEGRQVMADIQSIYDRLPPDGRLLVKIRGANHFFFSDDGALLKSHIVLGTLRKLGVLGIDGRRQLAVTTYCVRRFFDAHLKGPSVSRLDISSPLYPEIQVLE
jgi:predicted dienelactone hydrolase